MKRAVLAIIASLAVAYYVCAESVPKAVGLRMPRPAYGKDWPEGTGVFLLHLDKNTGEVLSVDVVHSTGFGVLDRPGVAAFKQWRFRAGPTSIKIPLTFTHRRQSEFLNKRPVAH